MTLADKIDVLDEVLEFLETKKVDPAIIAHVSNMRESVVNTMKANSEKKSKNKVADQPWKLLADQNAKAYAEINAMWAKPSK